MRVVKKQPKPEMPRGRGRPRKHLPSSSEEEVEEEGDSSEVEESSEGQDDERSWEDRCYLCRKAGSLLCCETCSHVAHVACLGLKKKPDGDWHCEDCLVKMSQRRTTRGQTTKHHPVVATRTSRRTR